MMRKMLILTAFFAMTLTTNLYGQNPYKSIVPLRSNAESVEKLLGTGKKLDSNKVFYDTKDAEITLFYHQAGCDDLIISELKISKGTALGVKVSPKNPQNALELLTSLYDPLTLDNLVSQDLGEGLYIHFDLTQGIVIKGKKIKGKEMVESYYFIPGKIDLPKCLINQMDSTSKYVFSQKSSSFDNNCKSSHYGKIATFYIEEKLSSDEYEQLDYFAKNLSGCSNFIGNIIYYTKEGANASKTLEYVNKIKNYLVVEKKISPQRLLFEDYGVSENSYIDIFIRSDDLLLPKKE